MSDDGRHELEGAHRELMAKWERTSATWHDRQSREFERQYLYPLRPDIQLAMDGIRQLKELLNQTREACE